jgi:hypothetical protein
MLHMSTRRLHPAFLGATLLVFAGREAAAQPPERAWSVAIAAGAGWQPERQAGHLALLGGHAAAAVAARLTPALAVRLEGMLSSFGMSVDHVHGPCPPGTEPSACHAPAGAVRLRALTVGLTGGPRGRRTYATVGAGAYHLAEHPTDDGDTRLGFHAGLGRVLVRGRPGVVLEAQLHWVPQLELGGEWSVPVRLGMTF